MQYQTVYLVLIYLRKQVLRIISFLMFLTTISIFYDYAKCVIIFPMQINKLLFNSCHVFPWVFTCIQMTFLHSHGIFFRVFFLSFHPTDFVSVSCESIFMSYFRKSSQDSLRKNTPSNKTEALTKSINMYIWAIGRLNQLFIRGSYTQFTFLILNEVVSGKSPFVVIGPFCTPHSICRSIDFWQSSLQKCCVFIRRILN